MKFTPDYETMMKLYGARQISKVVARVLHPVQWQAQREETLRENLMRTAATYWGFILPDPNGGPAS